MDLISRDAVKEILDKGNILIDEDVEKCESMHEVLVYLLEKVDDFVRKSVDAMPTIDVAPVVRCKNCEHWGCGIESESEQNKYCGIVRCKTHGDDYCVHGDIVRADMREGGAE